MAACAPTSSTALEMASALPDLMSPPTTVLLPASPQIPVSIFVRVPTPFASTPPV